MTGSVTRSSVLGWEDVTALVRSSISSVLKSAFIVRCCFTYVQLLAAVIRNQTTNHRPSAFCKHPLCVLVVCRPVCTLSAHTILPREREGRVRSPHTLKTSQRVLHLLAGCNLSSPPLYWGQAGLALPPSTTMKGNTAGSLSADPLLSLLLQCF